ncbi:MAG TPA: hypothetical protein VFR97_06640 [Capillimicrobium sp.]|nr:hypothetical protein [Capillimicrobium sp.]
MELTVEQAREIARLRRRHPGADVVLHRRAHDLIVEIRHRGRTVTLTRLGEDGSVDRPDALAA